MAASNGTLTPYSQSVDSVFGLVRGQPPASATLVTNGVVCNTPTPARPDARHAFPPDWPTLPPELEHNPEARAAFEWLQRERKRLEEYTRAQFGVIHQNHQALLTAKFQREQEMALQGQRLNQENQLLASRAQALQERSNALTQREKAVTEREAALTTVQQELRTLEQTRDTVQVEVAAQRAALAELQAQVARAEQGIAESALFEAQRDLERRHAELSARQTQMEVRYQALEQAETAVARKAAELDELECRLGQEFEKQERQLALERREIETLRVKLQMNQDTPPVLRGSR